MELSASCCCEEVGEEAELEWITRSLIHKGRVEWVDILRECIPWVILHVKQRQHHIGRVRGKEGLSSERTQEVGASECKSTKFLAGESATHHPPPTGLD